MNRARACVQLQAERTVTEWPFLVREIPGNEAGKCDLITAAVRCARVKAQTRDSHKSRCHLELHGDRNNRAIIDESTR